jgi:hypothetical protein
VDFKDRHIINYTNIFFFTKKIMKENP